MAKKKENKEEKNTETVENASAVETEQGTVEEEQNPSKEEQLQQQYDDLNNKYLRLYSEFENFRKRTIKEKSDLISNAGANVIGDLLSILDDFERAIDHNKTAEDANSVKEGFELIYNKMLRILAEKGLAHMECRGETFDSDHHEAITNIPVEDKAQKGKIVDVVEKGYYLNDKVLRYAKVVVGQ